MGGSLKMKQYNKLSNQVLVFTQKFSSLRDKLNCYGKTLSQDERIRALKFRNEKARTDFILSRGFLREKLSLFLNLSPTEIEIAASEYGKPYLKSSEKLNYEFNISHSGDRLVLAITKGFPVGIDIEKINSQQNLEISQHVFSVDELNELNGYDSLEKIAAFYKGWTQKEAFIKAVGLGMSYPLKSFSVLLDPNLDGKLLKAERYEKDLKHVKMKSLELDPEYACSIFLEQEPAQIMISA